MRYRFVVYDSSNGQDVGHIDAEAIDDATALDDAEGWVELHVCVRVDRVLDPVANIVQQVDILVPIVIRTERVGKE